MHKSALTLLLSILIIKAIAQQDTVFMRYNNSQKADVIEYKTDTIIFPWFLDRKILIGTTVIPNTPNQYHAEDYGIYLTSVSKSDCRSHGEEVYWLEDKINYIEETDSTMVVDINIYDNCCYDFLCDMAVDKNGVINLIYSGYGLPCACDCCFGLRFHFIKAENSWHPDLTLNAVMLNGDKKSMKRIE